MARGNNANGEQNRTMDVRLIIDSGCTGYMLNDRNLFTQLDESQKGEVGNANESQSVVEGSGTAEIRVMDNHGHVQTILLSNALYVPTYSHNLVSVSRLNKAGVDVIFGKFPALIAPDGKRFPIYCHNSLFVLPAQRAVTRHLALRSVLHAEVHEPFGKFGGYNKDIDSSGGSDTHAAKETYCVSTTDIDHVSVQHIYDTHDVEYTPRNANDDADAAAAEHMSASTRISSDRFVSRAEQYEKYDDQVATEEQDEIGEEKVVMVNQRADDTTESETGLREYDKCYSVQAANTYDYADTANIYTTGYGDKEYDMEYGNIAKIYTARYGVAKYDLEYGILAKIYTAGYGKVEYEYHKYVTGYCFMRHLNTAAISWRESLQPIVATSTTEAAMMAAVEAANEAIIGYDVLLAIANDLGRPTIYCAVDQARTKYYAVKLINLCEFCSTVVALKFTPAVGGISDIFTKSVGRLKTRAFADELLHGIPASGGIRCNAGSACQLNLSN